MERVLILSCSTGQGHDACARALKEHFESRQVHCEIQDALAFISEDVATFIAWGHSFIYRYIPGLFSWGYQYSKDHSWVFRENSIFCKLLNLGEERLYHYIEQWQIDTVICTHIFAAIILTRLQQRYTHPLRTSFVATDYTYYPGMESTALQEYFIANAQFVEKYQQLGIAPEQILAVGIPVQKKFLYRLDKTQAKQCVGVKTQHQHLLIMCGSMGCGPIKDVLSQIVEEMPPEVEVTVICGTNKRLYRRLKRHYAEQQSVHIVGYTDRIPLYMDAADLCLTKPGGLSITEAAFKELPMVFVDAVAGCERYNMAYFMAMGAAVTASSPAALAQESLRLLSSDQALAQMAAALKQWPRRNSADDIFRRMDVSE